MLARAIIILITACAARPAAPPAHYWSPFGQPLAADPCRPFWIRPHCDGTLLWNGCRFYCEPKQ